MKIQLLRAPTHSDERRGREGWRNRHCSHKAKSMSARPRQSGSQLRKKGISNIFSNQLKISGFMEMLLEKQRGAISFHFVVFIYLFRPELLQMFMRMLQGRFAATAKHWIARCAIKFYFVTMCEIPNLQKRDNKRPKTLFEGGYPSSTESLELHGHNSTFTQTHLLYSGHSFRSPF